MSSGAQGVADFVRRVEALVALDREVAAEAAKPVADIVRENIAAAETPTGEAWPERQEGGPALRGAAAGVASRATGIRIVLTLDRPWAFHNWGAGGSSASAGAKKLRAKVAGERAKGTRPKSRFHAPRRQMLPDSGTLPEPMADEIAAAAKRVFDRTTGAR